MATLSSDHYSTFHITSKLGSGIQQKNVREPDFGFLDGGYAGDAILNFVPSDQKDT